MFRMTGKVFNERKGGRERLRETFFECSLPSCFFALLYIASTASIQEINKRMRKLLDDAYLFTIKARHYSTD